MARRAAVYSSARRTPPPAVSKPAPTAAKQPPPEKQSPAAAEPRRKRHIALATVAAGIAGALIWFLMPTPAIPTEGLEEAKPAQLSAAEAYEMILPSVVHVRGYAEGEDESSEKDKERQSGTGVIIVDNGTILTNLHVVQGAAKVKVTFADGSESAADVVGARPEHDLAVIKARNLPDDTKPATLRSTQGLRPGDPVVAVGFPFGIGPSASAGVISGLKREYRSGEGKTVLSNLIQFDAAVNPGNSGGPLVTHDGEVIGIVTGLLNPTTQRVFIGIGFAVPIENAAGAVGLSPF
jgi:S1-C subfamily serine protease